MTTEHATQLTTGTGEYSKVFVSATRRSNGERVRLNPNQFERVGYAFVYVKGVDTSLRVAVANGVVVWRKYNGDTDHELVFVSEHDGVTMESSVTLSVGDTIRLRRPKACEAGHVEQLPSDMDGKTVIDDIVFGWPEHVEFTPLSAS